MTQPIQLPSEPLVLGDTALRPWSEDDLEQLVQACRDPEIVRFTRVPPGYTERDGRQYIASRRAAAAERTAASMAIVAARDLSRLLGSVSLFRFSWRDARGEIGYWLAPSARGQGSAGAAVAAICGWGFAALGLGRIDLLAATDNLASQRVAERAGFTREALMRSSFVGNTGRQDMVAFGLLAGELRVPSAGQRGPTQRVDPPTSGLTDELDLGQ